MKYPGKGRAMGYSDYFKGKAVTPGMEDDEEDDNKPSGISIQITGMGDMNKKNARQIALRRRLAKKTRSQ